MASTGVITRQVLVRIKRRATDDPLDALVLDAKKRRVESEEPDAPGKNSDEIPEVETRVFRLLQTVPLSGFLEVDDVLGFIEKREQEPLKGAPSRSSVKDASPTVQRKKEERAEKVKETIRQARYKVVANRRGVKEPVRESLKRTFEVVDIEREDDAGQPAAKKGPATSRRGGEEQPKRMRRRPVNGDPYRDDALMCNSVPLVREKLSLRERVAQLNVQDSGSETDEEDRDYVYDYYYQTVGGEEAVGEGMVRIETFRENLMLEEEYDTSSDDDVDEDSNDENHWAADYPDENNVFYSSEEDGDEQEEEEDYDSDADPYGETYRRPVW
eukprot:comp21911_c1_seq1/m.31464 comp21911_c1_seq1/g.31464  ORF comp21911_c1_seq1/g.31464 comp21911_c1_seq1/m.31464 type:complete len:328 (-) comp21911_c1_seq1:655-1638(-)